MKAWKEELLTALETEAETMKEVGFYDVAKSKGYSHIHSEDVRDILYKFCKRHPEYRQIVKLDREGQHVSLFTHGYVTMLEYEPDDICDDVIDLREADNA